jgi:4-hydroxy-tetrahydrodipicolinate synthase
MNVFAGERVVDSYMLGATGYVNPYANYIPEASTIICEYLANKEYEKAERISNLIEKLDAIIALGHPTYGHQCYSKALAAVRGYPVGDVRPPLTKFTELGAEGTDRVKRITAIMNQLDDLLKELN